MNEAEWNTTPEPQSMLAFLRDRGQLSERKARLLAVACCRRVWHLLTDGRSRRAIAVAERVVEGQVP